jgi:hypothetical protein
MIPAYRITHADTCGAHLGYVCSCDREQLAAMARYAVTALTCSVIVILALLAAVLK